MNYKQAFDLTKHIRIFFLLNTIFHGILLTGIDSGNLLSLNDNTLSFTALGLLAAFFFTGAYLPVAGMKNPASRQAVRFICSMTCLLFFPFYMLNFPVNMPICLTGIVSSALQTFYLLKVLFTVENSQRHYREKNANFIDLQLICSSGCFIIFIIVPGQKLGGSLHGLLLSWTFVLISLTISIWNDYKNNKHKRISNLLSVLCLLLLIFVQTRTLCLVLLSLKQVISGFRVWLYQRGGRKIWNELIEHPTQLLVLSFVFVITAGTIMLMLPSATTAGNELSFLDALFTATSATCVTGLIVVDTPTAFTFSGQCTVLALIQIGGLGIMTISTFFALILGRSIGVKGEFAIKEMVGEEQNRTAISLLQFIVLSTLSIELIGGLILAFQFYTNMDLPLFKSIYFGIFHSISAFCNGGFALYSDSLESFDNAPGIVITISFIIILGGLGFGVMHALLRNLFGKRQKILTPYVKLVFLMTLILLFGGTLFFLIADKNNAFSGMGTGEAILHSWFQSVTARTAGFNSINLNNLHPSSQVVMSILMFIGASPGSTAGGIKITTVAVLFLVIRSILTGSDDVVFARRRIARETVLNAAALIIFGIFILLTGLTLLLLTQNHLPPGKVVFETISAFGTVGVSQGITADLNPVGKIIIIILMFIGRIGPLTLIVMMKPGQKSLIRYPTADVMVG